jgi:hypothetical protein
MQVVSSTVDSPIAVQHVGIEIRAVGPYDRSQLGVDRDLPELLQVSERLEHRPPQLGLEIDMPAGPSLKRIRNV